MRLKFAKNSRTTLNLTNERKLQEHTFSVFCRTRSLSWANLVQHSKRLNAFMMCMEWRHYQYCKALPVPKIFPFVNSSVAQFHFNLFESIAASLWSTLLEQLKLSLAPFCFSVFPILVTWIVGSSLFTLHFWLLYLPSLRHDSQNYAMFCNNFEIVLPK